MDLVLQRRGYLKALCAPSLLLTALASSAAVAGAASVPATLTQQVAGRSIAQPAMSAPRSWLALTSAQPPADASFSYSLDVYVPAVAQQTQAGAPVWLGVLLDFPVLAQNSLSVTLLDYALQAFYAAPPEPQQGVNRGPMLALYTFPIAPLPPPQTQTHVNLADFTFTVAMPERQFTAPLTPQSYAITVVRD